MKKTKSGFVAIIGPTNAGKSTLLNQIMGRKVSIVSHKVQTTRSQLRAIKMIGDTQVVFIDTPGVFRPNRRLDRAMVSVALSSMNDADAILLIIDATRGVTQTVRNIAAKLPANAPKFAVLNKADAVEKAKLLPMAEEINGLADFKEVFMISARKGYGIDAVLKSLADIMPEADYMFDPKDAVDVPDELFLAEITREKIYKYLHQELPYRIHVSTEKIEQDDEGVIEIWQKILVATDGQKKIVIGRGGEQLKKIGTEARHEIQDEWGVNARLKLFVRVEKDWEDRAENYEEQGLEFKK
jgi:GTP-binding protein Era